MRKKSTDGICHLGFLMLETSNRVSQHLLLLDTIKRADCQVPGFIKELKVSSEPKFGENNESHTKT